MKSSFAYFPCCLHFLSVSLFFLLLKFLQLQVFLAGQYFLVAASYNVFCIIAVTINGYYWSLVYLSLALIFDVLDGGSPGHGLAGKGRDR